MMKAGEAIQQILDAEGYDDPITLANECEFGNRCGVPCICRECGAQDEREPDVINSLCHDCGARSVDSLYVLMGVM